jgi:molybdopterin-guanine dinucleotide biosynthesis protein A
MHNITGIIAAGGKSLRMGRDKARLTVNDISFIEIQVQKLKIFCNEILIGRDDSDIYLPGTIIVKDAERGKGPMMGIYSCLKASKFERSILLPVDTPNISIELINELLNHSVGYDVTIPSYKGKIHPLIGIYDRCVLPKMEKELMSNSLKMLTFIEKTNYRIVNTDNYHEQEFININTPGDYASLLSLIIN